jgi:tetratricopeptide (TPR) repeat protein
LQIHDNSAAGRLAHWRHKYHQPLTMKTPIIFGLLLTSTGLALGADTLTEGLQKGLFEEEANHNLEAAIQAYRIVINQADEQRKIAATAVFRLGECFRKQAKTNEAVAHYERILRDFSDQVLFAKLSQQNLEILGKGSPAKAKPALVDLLAVKTETAEIQRLQALLQDSPDLVNARDDNGLTPLHRAVSAGQMSVAEFLLTNNSSTACSNSPVLFWMIFKRQPLRAEKAAA